jgi:hypothetical protein
MKKTLKEKDESINYINTRTNSTESKVSKSSKGSKSRDGSSPDKEEINTEAKYINFISPY